MKPSKETLDDLVRMPRMELFENLWKLAESGLIVVIRLKTNDKGVMEIGIAFKEKDGGEVKQ